MTKSNRAVKSIITMIAFSLGSSILGLIREILVASKFGSGMKTDAFFVALTATGILTTLLGNSISTTLIPILSEVEEKEGKRSKISQTNNILNIGFFISLLIVIIGWVFAPFVIKITAGGFEGEQFKLAISLMRIGLPVMFFWNIVGVFRGFLQSEMRFIESSTTQYPYNLVFLVYLLLFSGVFGIKGLMVSSVVAVGSQILIQIPGMVKVGYKYNFIFDIKDKYIRKVSYLIPPVLIAVLIDDLNMIIDRALASRLVTGSISALNYSNRLNGIILGVFIAAITTVIFPSLSKASNSDNIPEMKRIMGYGVNSILIITIPATVIMIVLAKPIVEIAFQRGHFDINATYMTSAALVFYSLGLVPMALKLLVIRVYYSLQDTKTPMINGAIAVIINIILNLILVRYMYHRGLALATSIATAVATLLLFCKLRRKIGFLGVRGYCVTFIKSSAASIIIGGIAYVIYYELHTTLSGSTLMNLVSLVGAVGVAGIVYLTLIYFFRVDGVKEMLDELRQRFKK